MPTIREKMRQRKVETPKKREPLWTGPEGEGPNGGITQSMIGRWLTCRERARVRYVEGLSPPEQFNHRLEYGNMWHLCEESYASPGPDYVMGEGQLPVIVATKLKKYAMELCQKYPTQQAEIEKWWNVCRVQFPIYVAHWAKHPQAANRTSLLAEQVFDVPYSLPSGRTVRLRGKWDGVSLVKEKGRTGIWLDEHKTKGDIDPMEVQRQLSFDLQVNLYLIALKTYLSSPPGLGDLRADQVVGVRYNVVRRPLSGGEGMITQKKGSKNVRPETSAEYYARLRGVIDGTGVKSTGENYEGPEYWFMRWDSEVSATNLKRFAQRCLDPILEQICCWYGSVTGNPQPVPAWAQNYQHPFGVTNSIDEYGSSDLDTYLATGSRVGLVESTLFKELR